MLFKSVGIIARYDKKAALKLAEELAEYLSAKGLKVFIEDTLADKISSKEEMVPLSKMKTDFLITIGGDGTILRTCIGLVKPEPPILAINMGLRGFLTEIEPKNAFEAIDKILKGDYKIEKSSKLSVSSGEDVLPDALNDVVISAGEPSKLLYAQICKDDKPILTCQADGLIVASETGSTGYSFSAGGPVLDPAVDAFVVTPICSLTVFHSIVFPAKSTVTFRMAKAEEILVLIDGKFRKQIKCKEPTVEVTVSKNNTSFIRFETAFYDRLKSRLLFKGTQ